jgi:hypothetical protein
MILAVILTCKFNFIFVEITHALTNIHLIYITKYKIKSENDAIYTACFDVEFFSFGATTPICALAYLHETLRFTSAY